eukprot:6174200-Pleurochrysis_carterae.AAC.3
MCSRKVVDSAALAASTDLDVPAREGCLEASLAVPLAGLGTRSRYGSLVYGSPKRFSTTPAEPDSLGVCFGSALFLRFPALAPLSSGSYRAVFFAASGVALAWWRRRSAANCREPVQQ